MVVMNCGRACELCHGGCIQPGLLCGPAASLPKKGLGGASQNTHACGSEQSRPHVTQS